MAKVEIYSGPGCPYCVRAKSLLDKKGVEYTEHDIRTDANALGQMMERTNGARSIPQIFINDNHIGGCDDLYALNDKGELDTLLND